MFVSFNYRCPTCGGEEPKFVKKAARDEQFCQIDCGGDRPTRMIRLPSAPKTHFRFADKKLK